MRVACPYFLLNMVKIYKMKSNLITRTIQEQQNQWYIFAIFKSYGLKGAMSKTDAIDLVYRK